MRAVLVLRYWEDLSEVETADLLSCSVGTVKAQASRGLARLRVVLGPPAPPAKAPPTPPAGPPPTPPAGPQANTSTDPHVRGTR
jgi:hypothetical protein